MVGALWLGEAQRRAPEGDGCPEEMRCNPSVCGFTQGGFLAGCTHGRPPLFSLPQAHSCTRKDFEKMYPAFPKFCSVREKLDPTGMFLNTYLEKVFY